MKRIAIALLAGLMLAVPAFAQQPLSQQDKEKVARVMVLGQSQQKHVRGYALVLLLGDTQSGPMPEALSPQAKKALGDIKDFLPYKSYRVLDTQWLAGSDMSASQSSGTLRGVNEESLPFNLEVQNQSTEKLKLFGAGGRTILLENSFTARPGETVVVGTSRLPLHDKGTDTDKALVVLFSVVEATP